MIIQVHRTFFRQCLRNLCLAFLLAISTPAFSSAEDANCGLLARTYSRSLELLGVETAQEHQRLEAFGINRSTTALLGEGRQGATYVGIAPEAITLSNGRVIQKGEAVVVKAPKSSLLRKNNLIEREYSFYERLGNSGEGFVGSAMHGPFLVQEYFPKAITLKKFLEELSDYRSQLQFSPTLKADFMRQLSAAGEALKEKGVVHGDLDPSNILVIAEGDRYILKVIDFGSAALVGDYPQYLFGLIAERTCHAEIASPNVQRNGPASVADDAWALNVVSKILDSYAPRY